MLRSGPPPKRGPNPQGLTEKKFTKVLKNTPKGLIRKSKPVPSKLIFLAGDI